MKGKNILLIIAALVGILSLSAFSHPGGGNNTGEKPTRTISVTGTGKTYLTPDIATISIGVHNEDVNVSTALNDNTAKIQAVTDALKGFGVEIKDIQTTNFSVYPSQQYGPMGEMLDLKYAVDNTITITVRDLTQFGTILSTVISQGANNVYGINFDVSDRSTAIADARQAAINDAKVQAEELATAAGVKVGQVISISVNVSNPTPIYADYYGRGGGMDYAAAAPAPVSSGQLLVTVDAYITYEMK